MRNLTEQEYEIVQHSIAQMKPLSVGATIDMFNGIGVYNKCIQQWILLYGYRYVAEIMNEQVQKAKDYLKCGNVVERRNFVLVLFWEFN